MTEPAIKTEHADLVQRLEDTARSLGDTPLDKFLRKLLREAAEALCPESSVRDTPNVSKRDIQDSLFE